VTRESRPCFHHGTRRRACSRVRALALVALHLRCDIVESIFSRRLQQTHHQSSSEQATTTYLRMPPLSRPLSRRGSAGSRGASLAPWLAPSRNSAALGSLPCVQENPQPRWGEEGRVLRVWGGGAPLSPPPSKRTLVPRRKS
jgi:hypothetical protein